MLKRPLNALFSTPVCEERKVTTIRKNPWPIGKPIMLYNWSGLAYRSKQVDVCAVEVVETRPITITNTGFGVMFHHDLPLDRPLWIAEGFPDAESLHAWFEAKIKPHQSVTMHIMQFHLHNAKAVAPPESATSPKP